MSAAWLVVVHGDIETRQENDLLERLRAAVEPAWRATRGTNDQTAFLLDSEALAAQCGTLDAALELLATAPHWWHWKVLRPSEWSEP